MIYHSQRYKPQPLCHASFRIVPDIQHIYARAPLDLPVHDPIWATDGSDDNYRYVGRLYNSGSESSISDKRQEALLQCGSLDVDINDNDYSRTRGRS